MLGHGIAGHLLQPSQQSSQVKSASYMNRGEIQVHFVLQVRRFTSEVGGGWGRSCSPSPKGQRSLSIGKNTCRPRPVGYRRLSGADPRGGGG